MTKISKTEISSAELCNNYIGNWLSLQFHLNTRAACFFCAVIT